MPIRFPWTTLPVAPDPAICNPSLPFPEMTFPAPAVDPPIVLFDPLTSTPWRPLPRAAVPAGSCR